MGDMGVLGERTILMQYPWKSYPPNVEGMYASNCNDRYKILHLYVVLLTWKINKGYLSSCEDLQVNLNKVLYIRYPFD